MSVNKVILVGRVGKDPESRTMSNGSPVVSFSLATSEKWKRDGEQQERTTWHNIVVFNEHIGRVVMDYVRKGSSIYLEGSIQSREYEKDGQKRYITEIVLQRFRGELQLLDSKGDTARPQRDAGNYGAGRDQYSGADLDDSDSIPF